MVGGQIVFQNGGNFCAGGTVAPDCDTSSWMGHGWLMWGGLASTNVVFESTNSADFTMLDHVQTVFSGAGGYGFRLLNLGGAGFS
jgi:hypothetical protein